jgi:D-lactate dehydrogenase
VRGAGLDVYEEEADLFFEDNSDIPVLDETLSLLVSRPNVIMTSHQAFLTEEALADIARTTFMNLDEYFSDAPVLTNEICYHCDRRKRDPDCLRNRRERCWKPIAE